MLIVLIHNDGTGRGGVGNYDCEVRVNNDIIARGRVDGHQRRDGWRVLLRAVADQLSDTEADLLQRAWFGMEVVQPVATGVALCQCRCHAAIGGSVGGNESECIHCRVYGL